MDVSAWMSRDVVTVTPNDTLSVAEEKMSHRDCRHLAVADDAGELIGIVTERDLRAYKGYLDTTKVSGVMEDGVIAIQPQTSVTAAAKIMIEKKIGVLPVVERDGSLVGLITSTDLLRALIQRESGS
jgi:acetoin utilization protein AcuB